MGAHGHHDASTSAVFLSLSFLCTTTALTCLNGGVFDGIKCICPPSYYGPRCEEGLDPSPQSTTAPTERPAPPVTSTSEGPKSSPWTTTVPIERPTSPVTRTTALICLNGGIFDGIKCICPPSYYGPRCEEGLDPSPQSTTAPTERPAPPVTSTTDACQNGGVWLGTACRCSRYFWGPRCEFVVNVIEVHTAVEAWIGVTAAVTNRQFTEALADASSPEYKAFAKEFMQQVEAIYRKVPEYHGTTVLQLSPGSVVVRHEVYVMLPLSARVGEAFRNASLRLVAALRGAAQEQEGCGPAFAGLCFKAASIQSSDGGIRIDSNEICRQAVPTGFGPHFSGRPTEAGFECVTRCAEDRPGSLRCKHGQCQVPLAGPQCYCPDTDTSWFLGEHCDIHISKVGLSIGFPLALTAALALVLALVQLRK